MRAANERGFLFLEAALLGLFLVLFAALTLLPEQAARLEERREARESAIFLAQQELAELTVRSGSLETGREQSFGWLGAAEDLSAHVQDYEVTGAAAPDGTGHRLRASVRWEMQGQPQELSLEKWVAHDAGE